MEAKGTLKKWPLKTLRASEGLKVGGHEPTTMFLVLLALLESCHSPGRKVKELVVQSCLTLCDPVDCSAPDSSVHGILQAGILEWVTTSFSRGSSSPRDRTWISCRISCIAGDSSPSELSENPPPLPPPPKKKWRFISLPFEVGQAAILPKGREQNYHCHCVKHHGGWAGKDGVLGLTYQLL